MHVFFIALIYLIFFLSGAAALIYEVVWVRYLSLIFGGSHLAVTTVLAVFMGGLALGSYFIGKRVASNAKSKLLQLYGFLELGIALSAVMFAILMRFYPKIYIPLAQIAPTTPLYLSFLRVTLATLLLVLPTTLMGGTLPVLSACVGSRMKRLGSQLSFLYGFNTLGAVAGTGAAGFFLLRYLGAGKTLLVALLINCVVGVAAILLQDKVQAALDEADAPANEQLSTPEVNPAETPSLDSLLPFRLVLWGIGVSGFCALGYEILWTRILSIVIGASVYGFAIMLMAFLTGIALGSAAYGVFLKISGKVRPGAASRPWKSIAGFGLVQIIIGITALIVTVYIRELPLHAFSLQKYVDSALFSAKETSSFVLAFSYMFVPAFFMGLAFPLAGKIHADYKKVIGSAVGEILAFNTVGAILGSAVSGFALIYLFGIERSLQILTIVNVAFGLLVITSLWGRALLNWGVFLAGACVVLVLVCSPQLWRVWNSKLFAIYQPNRPDLFGTPQAIRDVLAAHDILYQAEGVHALVSSIKLKGGNQSFLTNGRVEATDYPEGMQCQYTLGHLPMLLCKNPKKVFVLGTGSGMTLGATSAYPSVEQITLAEIEPKVLGVARTFARYNHDVLNNPKLRIVFNDGRNFLMTTKEKFDVITADPIHPWFSGAGYLYTTEYFRLAAEHLNPGGMACQWLPIYELTNDNLKSVVRSFSANFKYTMIWLTYDDAELVGSNTPIVLDEEELDRRIRLPEVQKDLQAVQMGSAEDFLSYLVMGSAGAAAYSNGGIINTDDNMYLEFSAPLSIGKGDLMGSNCHDIDKFRESILPYVKRPADSAARARQEKRWDDNMKAALVIDEVHALDLAGRRLKADDLRQVLAAFDAKYTTYAPWLFLRNEFTGRLGQKPKILRQTELPLIGRFGEAGKIQLAASVSCINKKIAVVNFIDIPTRVVFGHIQVVGENLDDAVSGVANDVLTRVQASYDEERKMTVSRGTMFPSCSVIIPKIKGIVAARGAQSRL